MNMKWSRVLILLTAMTLALTPAVSAKSQGNGKDGVKGYVKVKKDKDDDKGKGKGKDHDDDDKYDDKHGDDDKRGLERALDRVKNKKAREAIESALKKKDYKKLKEIILSAEDRVAIDQAWIMIGFAKGDGPSHITKPLVYLPSKGLFQSQITWSSSRPDVLSHDGKTLNRPAAGTGDVQVVLTATVQYGQAKVTRTFTFTVKQQVQLTSAQIVAKDKADLQIGYNNGDSANRVISPLNLSVKGGAGSTITWTSSAPQFISHDGKTVVRPAMGAGDATVVLTAQLVHGTVTESKSFTLIVKQHDMSVQQKLDADKAALAITFGTGESSTAVTGPIGLPKTGTNGSVITWVSSAPAVVSHDGRTVNRPAVGAGDVNVVLTAILTNGGISDTKVFVVTVKQQYTVAQKLEADKAALAIVYSTGDSANGVTKPITLPTAGANGSTISWISGSPNVISSDGKVVNRPAAGAGDVSVVLNAIISNGGLADTKSFTVIVRQQLTDTQKVAEDKAQLAIGFRTGDSAASVTGPITLPTVGANGTGIVWVSGSPGIVSHDGKQVNRPAAGTGDVTVTLTAIVTSGGVADSKVFQIVVKQR